MPDAVEIGGGVGRLHAQPAFPARNEPSARRWGKSPVPARFPRDAGGAKQRLQVRFRGRFRGDSSRTAKKPPGDPVLGSPGGAVLVV